MWLLETGNESEVGIVLFVILLCYIEEPLDQLCLLIKQFPGNIDNKTGELAMKGN